MKITQWILLLLVIFSVLYFCPEAIWVVLLASVGLVSIVWRHGRKIEKRRGRILDRIDESRVELTQLRVKLGDILDRFNKDGREES